MSVTEDIKERLDIVEIISGSVQLRKSGRSYVGFCPFHSNTRTPAFTVYPDSQSYHCFGCKASGDIFTFVMQQQGLEFRAALEMLAARAGVTLEARTPEEEQQDQRRTRLLEINAAAAKYFNYVLLALPKGEPGRQYLAERGINEQTIEAFQLGYSIDDWSRLLSYLTDKKGYEPEEVEAAGLAIRRNDGGYYDRFRGRLIFPIRNLKGETIAFGGRALGDAQPKYLNSPQTDVFDKSSVLYGLDMARDTIRSSDSIVIVEGYIDVLTGHQHGFRNLVAPLGTALTSQHVQSIKKLSRNIFLALDADAAGQRATLRGLATVSEEMDSNIRPVPTVHGLRWDRELNGTVKIIALPTGYDPDELIKSDPELWKHLVSDAKPVMDFYFTALTNDLDLQSAKGKSEAVTRLTPLLAQLTNPVEQAHYIQQLASLVEVDEQTVRSALFRESRSQQRPRNEGRERSRESRRDMQNMRNGIQHAEAYHNSQPAPSAQPAETPRPLSFVFTREDMLLVLLMRYPSGIPAVEAILSANLEQFPSIQQLLPTDPSTLFQRSENRLIWHTWRSQAAPSADLNAWMEDLPNELKEHARHLFEFKLPANQAYRYKLDIEQCTHFLRTEQARSLTTSLGKHIASLAEDDPERTSSMEQLLAIYSYLNTLKTPTRSPSYTDLRNTLNE
jgi:DNA primase